MKPDNVLHIGDNAKIDVEAAKKAGLHALLLPRPADVFMDADCTQMANLGHGCLAGFTTADAMQPLALRCAQGLAANRFFDDGYAPATADSAFAAYPSRLGYYAVGTHLLALAKWLLCRCRADGVKRLVFLARMVRCCGRQSSCCARTRMLSKQTTFPRRGGAYCPR